jgi:hypothetical protein
MPKACEEAGSAPKPPEFSLHLRTIRLWESIARGTTLLESNAERPLQYQVTLRGPTVFSASRQETPAVHMTATQQESIHNLKPSDRTRAYPYVTAEHAERS